MAEFKYTFNLETTKSGDGAEETKAAVDAVEESTKKASEASEKAASAQKSAAEEVKTAVSESAATQVKASEELKDALKEEFAALDALKKKSEERSAERKNTAAETEAHIEQLETLVDAVNRYNDALAAGDQEATIEALDEIKQGMDAVAESSDEIPPELEEINAELDELDKKVRGKKSFEKLSDQANDTSKSLKRIEKLQVAEAIGDIVSQARSAGKSLSELGKEGESATDTTLNAAGAVGDLASGVAAGFATGGPIGAGIALVTAGISFFSEKAKQAEKDIEELTKNLGTGFEQSQKSIEDAAAEVAEFEQGIQRSTDLLDEQNRKLQVGLDIQLKRAEIKARAEKDDIALDRLKIEGDVKFKDDPEGKAAALAELDKREIKVDSDFERDVLQTQIDKQQAILDQLRKAVEQAKQKAAEAFDESVAADGNQVTASFLKEDSSKQRGEANDQTKNLLEAIEAGTGFFDALSADELEDPLHDAIKDFKEFEVDPQSKTKDLDKIDAQIDFLKEVERILALPQVDQRDSDVVDANAANRKALSAAKAARESAVKANEIDADILAKDDKRKLANEQLEAAEKALNEQDDGILGNKKNLEFELEDVDRSERNRLERLKQKRLNQTNKREAQKRQREAEKKQKEIDREQGKAGQSVGSALDNASSVPGLTKEFKTRIAKAQTANADGTNSAEMKEVMSILNKLVSAGEKRSTVDTGLLSALQSQNAKVQAQDSKISQLSGELKKFKQLYNNNRR